ncbi:flavin-containing monooxygenase [Trujillonella endophytica]|uniref:flavin-containing monooxygenase n=1 Tax=Trujillonella endophytica TaxID=673521 RepID=UPI00147BB92A|nr:NAD(P)/FAD-dependent oxidoreductase [Trujillella endophytica]
MPAAREVSVLVIGAGAAGILMGIGLRERGIEDFVILEKAGSLGGTWRDNVYPGVACDVPAIYYSYSFAPNTSAPMRYATGRELWSYFDSVATDRGLAGHLRYGAEVTSAAWNGTAWEVETASGERWTAGIVVGAVGRLHRPRFPDIPGMADFAGVVRHASQWDPDLDLRGVRLGVIGTGSSSVQIVSAASQQVAHLDLFQRTAQWVYPRANEPVAEAVRAEMLASPEGARKHYAAMEAESLRLGEIAVSGTAEQVEARNQVIRDALAAVRDPVLRAKLTPDYDIGCKRLVISGTFYDAVQRPNVDVVTDGILRFEREGIRTTDGVLHPLDVVVLATGFHADNYLRPMRVRGAGGVDLEELWADVFLTYKSVAVPHLPNFFLINGPFSPGGSLNIIAVIENHAAFVLQLVDRVLAERVAIAPDAGSSAAFVDRMRDRAKGTVWYTGGCTSWYLDRDGVPLVAPMTLSELRAEMAEPVWADFDVRPLAGSCSAAS